MAINTMRLLHFFIFASLFFADNTHYKERFY